MQTRDDKNASIDSNRRLQDLNKNSDEQYLAFYYCNKAYFSFSIYLSDREFKTTYFVNKCNFVIF